MEKSQRNQQKPKVLRDLSILFRWTNLAYFAHLILTIYTEVVYSLAFVQLTELSTSLSSWPDENVKSHLLATGVEQ